MLPSYLSSTVPNQARRTWPRSPRNREFGKSKRRTRYIGESEIHCDGPGCDRFVPSGYVTPWQKKFFCCDQCDWAYYNRHHVIGKCLYCGGPVLGTPAKALVKKYCCDEHYELHRDQRTLGKTGQFRAEIESYLAGAAKNRYNGTLSNVKVTLVQFFGFIKNEGLTCIEDVGPATITKFIAYQRARGMTSANYIGHLSTYFKILQSEGRIVASPVIPYIHSQKGRPAEHRDYTESELTAISKIVEASGDEVLHLAFWLGAQCGLRIGEVCNIRLSDLDQTAQTVFVRLPTKNKRTRIVPYHDQVGKYLRLWLAKRDPDCKHDHLLHGPQLGRLRTSTLDKRFSDLLANAPEPAKSFKFHRCRHSWATALLNNGMELAVLKELGGWVSWNSMQRYVRVLPSTRDREYQAAYERMQKAQEHPVESSMSLADFAQINAEKTANADSAKG